MTTMPSRAAEYAQYAPGDFIPGPDLVVVMRLGAGGQGEVYLCWDEYADANYVVKLLSLTHIGLDAEHDFQREVRLMLKLNHTNIVRVTRGGWTREDISRPFYIMAEEKGAKTLAAVLADRTPLSILHTLGLAMQACEALHYVHTLKGPDGEPMGCVHRDLKPANILLTKEVSGGAVLTVLKLLDFGIA